MDKGKSPNARKISETLTRRDLVSLVAKRLQKSESEVAETVDVTIDSISRLLRTASPEIRIELRGLGVFEVKFMKAAATVRDPRTGEKLVYAGRRRKAHFRPSKLIKKFLQKDAKAEGASDSDSQSIDESDNDEFDNDTATPS
jgi:integration host factor subunit beta